MVSGRDISRHAGVPSLELHTRGHHFGRGASRHDKITAVVIYDFRIMTADKNYHENIMRVVIYYARA